MQVAFHEGIIYTFSQEVAMISFRRNRIGYLEPFVVTAPTLTPLRPNPDRNFQVGTARRGESRIDNAIIKIAGRKEIRR